MQQDDCCSKLLKLILRNPKHHSTFFHEVDISVMSTEHNQPRTLAQENKGGCVFAFAARTRSGYEPNLLNPAMSSTTMRRRRAAEGAAGGVVGGAAGEAAGAGAADGAAGAGAAGRQRRADAPLVIGEADRKLDALIEEEVRRTRSADAGPRRQTEVGSTPRGPPASFRPPVMGTLDEGPRELEAGVGVASSSLKSVKPGELAATPPAAAGSAVGLGALHDAVQRTYQVLQQALAGQPQGQGLLAPLGPGIDPAARGGLFGDGSGLMNPRALDYGQGVGQTPVRSPNINPFWSPGVQEAARRGMTGGGQAGGGGTFPEAQGDGKFAAGNPTANGSGPCGIGQNSGPTSPGQDDVEVLRAKILREAEETFQRELRRLGTSREPTDTTSYKTVSSGQPLGDLALDQPPGLPQGRHPLLRSATDQGSGQKVVRIGGGASTASMTEALRNLELPALPSPNVEGASILFGDWLTMSFPLMADISHSAKAWWEESLSIAQEHYARWLTMSPLERLRAKPVVVVEPALQRIEQRGIAMLLGALPDQLRRDLVSGRQLSVVHILYRLHVAYQPGGGAEKTQLLKNLVETRFATGTSDLLTQVRLWRRWLTRAQELHLSLPDPVVLMVTVQRMIDSATKSGGSQMAFRIANVRQELRVDYAATVEAVMELAEYVQAEVEEVSLVTPMKVQPPTATSGASGNQQSTAVKAMATAFGGADSEDKTAPKHPCRFWRTDEGCKRGTNCSYAHDTTDMKGRCYNCGGAHFKKDCPNGGKMTKPDAKDGRKVAKVKNSRDPERTETGEKLAPETGKTDESRTDGGSPPITRSEPVVEKTQGKDATAELQTEATSLLKALRTMKVLRLKELKPQCLDSGEAVALLDGGATNGLRRARPHEMNRLVPVTVELASGSTTLFRVKEHSTLLTKEQVEVIVPLHRLVKLGYKLQWTSAGVKINHPQSGRIDCTLRGGCPVLPEKQALALLDVMEKEDQGELMLDAEVRRWWSMKFPEVPQEVWGYMRGQDHYNPEECPWNRHQRRRHARAPGVIIHLYSGRNSKAWTKENWGGYEVINVDITMGTQFDMHAVGTWSYLCHLARSGHVVAVVGGPPCRSVSRLRHREPGPRPLRRDALDWRVYPWLSRTWHMGTWHWS